MGKIVFGNRQKPAGILVDPVDDARPLHPADAGKIIAAVIKQRIDQRSVIYARRRVNGHSRRLVDDDQVVVFKTTSSGMFSAAGSASSPAARKRRNCRPNAL